MNSFDLTGKVAIVTGAQRGIGLGIATRIAQAGAEVFVSGIADAEGKAAADALKRDGFKADYCHMDVRSEESVVEAINNIVARHGRIDVAVANAAIYPNTPIAKITTDEWDAVLEVNLRGSFLLARRACHIFKCSEAGVSYSFPPSLDPAFHHPAMPIMPLQKPACWASCARQPWNGHHGTSR
jgi:3-oxoacyl-[acyl-carrier protein] reductase